jgi:hypothetical protein
LKQKGLGKKKLWQFYGFESNEKYLEWAAKQMQILDRKRRTRKHTLRYHLAKYAEKLTGFDHWMRIYRYVDREDGESPS